MRRADAPPPGWYPDPTGGVGLWWWDGLDWTDHRRPPPPTGHVDDGSTSSEGGASDERRAIPTATQLRSRTEEARSDARREARRAEGDAAALVAEARRAARAEVDKAVTEFRGQVSSTTEQWRPRVEEYRRRLRRWLRVAVVVVVVLVVLSTWLNATASMGLLEWLGERIDNATTLVVPVTGLAGLRSRGGPGPIPVGGRPTHGAAAPAGRGARLR